MAKRNRIRFQKVIQDLDLDEYYGSGEAQIIKVWVNPPRAILGQNNENVKEGKAIVAAIRARLGREPDKTDAPDEGESPPDNASQETVLEPSEADLELARRMKANQVSTYAFFSTVWSQDADESTHWSVEDVEQLHRDCNDRDPGLWKFATTLTIGMMNDYTNLAIKKGRRR